MVTSRSCLLLAKVGACSFPSIANYINLFLEILVMRIYIIPFLLTILYVSLRRQNILHSIRVLLYNVLE